MKKESDFSAIDKIENSAENQPGDDFGTPEERESSQEVDFDRNTSALKELSKQTESQSALKGYNGPLSRLAKTGRLYMGSVLLSLVAAGCHSKVETKPASETTNKTTVHARQSEKGVSAEMQKMIKEAEDEVARGDDLKIEKEKQSKEREVVDTQPREIHSSVLKSEKQSKPLSIQESVRREIDEKMRKDAFNIAQRTGRDPYDVMRELHVGGTETENYKSRDSKDQRKLNYDEAYKDYRQSVDARVDEQLQKFQERRDIAESQQSKNMEKEELVRAREDILKENWQKTKQIEDETAKALRGYLNIPVTEFEDGSISLNINVIDRKTGKTVQKEYKIGHENFEKIKRFIASAQRENPGLSEQELQQERRITEKVLAQMLINIGHEIEPKKIEKHEE